MLAGSNYLDLAGDARVIAAAQEASASAGCAAGGSRLINGNLCLHEALEQELASFVGAEAALIFSTGYMANLGVITTLAGPDDVIIYRVYADDLPVAALFAVTARDGYAGAIRVLIGIEYDGTITGIRILEHRETPGLGDKIVSSRSDWVYQFDGRSLGDPRLEEWAIKRDGGEFDQLTGASVTPRAVIKVAKETLIYFAAHRDEIFSASATEDTQ